MLGRLVAGIVLFVAGLTFVRVLRQHKVKGQTVASESPYWISAWINLVEKQRSKMQRAQFFT